MPHPLFSSSTMMAPRLILISLVAILVSGGLALAWLRGVRALYAEQWAHRRFRQVFYGLLFGWGAAMVLQPVARLLEVPREVRVVLMATGAIGLVALGLSTPFLWLGVWLRRRVERADRALETPTVAATPAPASAPVLDTSLSAPSDTPAPLSPVAAASLEAPVATTGTTASTAPSDAPSTPEPARSRRGPTLTRRELALATARLAPLGGAMVAGTGAREGQELARLVEVEMAFPNLPPALEGLRILQYSDVHLGYFVDMVEIDALVEQGKRARADLVVLTGDIADDLPSLPRALELFDELGPRLGVYASIGNHEYFRGIRETRRAYDASKVPLLLQQGHTLEVDGARLHLSGADDPRFMGRQNHDFFERTVGVALDGAPSDAFHVLMSHRPEGFLAARKAGVHLTLSGHTHGAQVGVGGRSILEPLLPDKYLWGPYQEDASRLYTSSGAGHWFPFRLGCPRELPVIKLVRGPITQAAVKRIIT